MRIEDHGEPAIPSSGLAGVDGDLHRRGRDRLDAPCSPTTTCGSCPVASSRFCIGNPDDGAAHARGRAGAGDIQSPPLPSSSWSTSSPTRVFGERLSLPNSWGWRRARYRCHGADAAPGTRREGDAHGWSSNSSKPQDRAGSHSSSLAAHHRALVCLRRHAQRAVPARSRPPRRHCRTSGQVNAIHRPDAGPAEADPCRRRTRWRQNYVRKHVSSRTLTGNRSLVYNAWVTLSSTLLGFAFGTVLGVVIAVGIVHSPRSTAACCPGSSPSQTIPILAVAPMIIVVLASIGVTGPASRKALISTYLSFFPVAVGMVKGLRSPETMHLDLMRTYNASATQTFWKLEGSRFDPVPLHLDEGGSRRQPGRRHRRRTAHQARRRYRRQAAWPAPITARRSISGRRSSPARYSPPC